MDDLEFGKKRPEESNDELSLMRFVRNSLRGVLCQKPDWRSMVRKTTAVIALMSSPAITDAATQMRTPARAEAKENATGTKETAGNEFEHLPDIFSRKVLHFEQSTDPKPLIEISQEKIDTALGILNKAFERIDNSDSTRRHFQSSEIERTNDIQEILGLWIKESKLDQSQRSRSGAKGIGQVKDIAEEEVKRYYGIKKNYDLNNAEDNAVVSILYLHALKNKLAKQFDRKDPNFSRLLYLTYNGGEGRVESWGKLFNAKTYEPIVTGVSKILANKNTKRRRKWDVVEKTEDPTYGVTFREFDRGNIPPINPDSILFAVNNIKTTTEKAAEMIRYSEMVYGCKNSLVFGEKRTMQNSAKEQTVKQETKVERQKTISGVTTSPFEGEGIWDIHARFRIKEDFYQWKEEFKKVNNLYGDAVSSKESYVVPGVQSIEVTSTLYDALKKAGVDPTASPMIWDYNERTNPGIAGKDIDHIVDVRIYIPPFMKMTHTDTPAESTVEKKNGQYEIFKVSPDSGYKSVWGVLNQIKPENVKITPRLLEDIVVFNKNHGNKDFAKADANGMRITGLNGEYSVYVPAKLLRTISAPESKPTEKETTLQRAPDKKVQYEHYTQKLGGDDPNPYRVAINLYNDRKTNFLKDIEYMMDENESDYARRKILRYIIFQFNQVYYPILTGERYDERKLNYVLVPTDPRYFEKFMEGEDEGITEETIKTIEESEPVKKPPKPVEIPKEIAGNIGQRYIDKKLDTIGEEVIKNVGNFSSQSIIQSENYKKFERTKPPRKKTTGIILHSTGSESPGGIIRSGKAHFVIDMKGNIIALRNILHEINHAGVGRRAIRGASWNGNDRITYETIGIEVCQKKGHEYNETQYKALKNLIGYLGQTFGIKKRNVLAHSQVSCSPYGRGRKGDPFIEIDWDKLGLSNNSLLRDKDVENKLVRANFEEIVDEWNPSKKYTSGLRMSEALRQTAENQSKKARAGGGGKRGRR